MSGCLVSEIVEFLEVFEGGIFICVVRVGARPLATFFAMGLGLVEGSRGQESEAAISRGEFSQCLECPIAAPFGPVERVDDSEPLECLDRLAG